MREYGQVQCSFWRDHELTEAGADARLLAVYLLTSPHSNGLGCYFLPDGYLATDLEWDSQRVREAFEKLSAIGFAKRCSKTAYVLIPKFLFWNEITNGNVAVARRKEFDTIPRRAEIHTELCTCIKHFGKHLGKDFEKVLDDRLNQEPTRTEKKERGTESPRPSNGNGEDPPAGEPRRKAWGTAEDEALAKRMFEAIKVVAPTAKEPTWHGWANAIRLMREQDERTHEQIWELFVFANRDSFWRVNILSPATLRDKWTQLEAKRGARRPGPPEGLIDYSKGVGPNGAF